MSSNVDVGSLYQVRTEITCFLRPFNVIKLLHNEFLFILEVDKQNEMFVFITKHGLASRFDAHFVKECDKIR